MSDHETTLRSLATWSSFTPDLKAACRAGAEALRRGTWQPIATAPRAMTWVLLWLPGWDYECRVGQWVELGDDASGWYGREWKEVFRDGPTHWMPLPVAPTEPTR